jgi:hypothetical protein
MNAVNISEIFPRHDKITRRRVRPIEQRRCSFCKTPIEVGPNFPSDSSPLCSDQGACRARVRKAARGNRVLTDALDLEDEAARLLLDSDERVYDMAEESSWSKRRDVAGDVGVDLFEVRAIIKKLVRCIKDNK